MNSIIYCLKRIGLNVSENWRPYVRFFLLSFILLYKLFWCLFLSYISGVCVTCSSPKRNNVYLFCNFLHSIPYMRCNTVEKPHNFYLHKFILLRFITLLPKWMYFTIADVYNAMSGNTMPQRIMYRHFMLWMCYVLILKERSKWRKIC